MITRLMPWLFGLAVVLLAGTTVSDWFEDREHAKTLARADSLAAEASAERLRAEGWEARFGEEVPDLQERVAEMDSLNARLAQELRQARVRISTLTQVTASSGGEVESQGEEVPREDDEPEEGAEEARHWEGEIADGPLAAFWEFGLPDARLAFRWSVVIPGEIITAETGDGRTLVTARSTSERARLEIGEVLIDPPPPVVESRLDWKLGLVVFTAGVVTAVLAGV